VVLIAGPLAFKFACHHVGLRCNKWEARVWHETESRRRQMLCPVLACFPGGLLLVMKSVVEITEVEAQDLRNQRGFPDWDYEPGGEECPFEFKASDWGRIDGKLVAVDYSVTAIDEDTN
jgi:hypothetical protein